MPSSSAYAAPIDLDLRPGRWEQGGRVGAAVLAWAALASVDLPLPLQLLGAAVALLMLFRDAGKASSRSARMRLHADGSVECTSPGDSRDEPGQYPNLRGNPGGAPVGAGSARDLSLQPTQGSRAEPAPTGSAQLLLWSTASVAETMHPAMLLQATSFFGLAQLHWSDSADRQHACLMFPDRIDADTRHRLRVWLATHRPDNSIGALAAGSTPQ